MCTYPTNEITNIRPELEPIPIVVVELKSNGNNWGQNENYTTEYFYQMDFS
jgi:hypothetical protein